jgi:hypothetical protein
VDSCRTLDEKPRVHRVDEHGIVHAVPRGNLWSVPSRECVGRAGRWEGRVSNDVVPTCLLCIGSYVGARAMSEAVYEPLEDIDRVVHAVQQNIFEECRKTYVGCWSLPHYYFMMQPWTPARPLTCLSCITRQSRL